ncbi:serine/threonine-protein kinase [Archangium sp.]|uniref:serine/threonine-protein kinase n=1 Tax=Archangium sp. TaxID=1872627 RepID=UPI00389A460C
MRNGEHDSVVAYLNLEEGAVVPAPAAAPAPSRDSRGSGPARTLLLGSSEHPVDRVPAVPGQPVVRGLIPGQVMAERYRVERWLGSGGSAMVHEVTDLTTGTHLALKVLAVPSADASQIARFRQEVEHARLLDHPNIVRVYDVGVDGERHFLTTELLVGMDLKHRLMGPRPTLAESLRWLTHAAAALEHAHGRGVLHRDVKPGNLFLTKPGILKLMDFGLAKSAHVAGVTTQGAVLGTPEYMAPEQISGAHPMSPASDLYSLGVVAYELFTGQLPFRHPQPVPLMFLHVQQPPTPPRTLNPNLPEPFERMVLKLMQKHPEQRYPSAAALRADLARLWPLALPPKATSR